jgi:CHAT domain-containing protein/tetratricopeptide (TPR) repeat protein
MIAHIPSIMNSRKNRMFVVACLVLVFAALFEWLPRFMGDGPEHVDLLLRQAYTSHRNMELRWQGAGFSVYSADQSETGGSESPSLLRAQEIIAKTRNASDPVWIRLQGKLALLLGEPQVAVKLLGRVHDVSPKSVPVLIDLASAYFEKAEKDRSDVAYGKSLELLGEALNLEPGNTLALYNCAIVEDRLFLYRQAADHWNSYIALDKSSGWSSEAKQRLAEIRKKLEQHESRIKAPLRTAAEVAENGLPRNSDLRSEVDARVEEYSEAAVQDWLPQAYAANPDHHAVNALDALGQLLLQDHGDSWLLDFMKTQNLPASQKAVQVLQQSIRANIQGDAVNGQLFARKARMIFRGIGSEPGSLRADVEEVNALRLLFKSADCIALSRQLEKPLVARRYFQLLARMELEHTACLVRAGEQGTALESLKRAEAAVNEGRLGSQKINVINYQSALEALKDGRSEPLWKMSLNALQLFWSGLFPDKRAYPFYASLADWAEENSQPFLFLEFAREAAVTIDATELTSFRAMAHYRFAEAALAASRDRIAKDEFNHSEELFQTMPQNESVLIHRAGIEVLLAGLEAQRGEHEQPLARLARIEPRVHEIASFLTQYQFYSTRALLFAREGNYPDAESDYRRAIAAAEGSLSSVKDERDRLAWSRSYGTAYRGLSQVLINESRTDEALRVWESFRASDLRTFAKGTAAHNQDGVKDLADAQSSLGISAALVYMLTDDGLAIWAVSSQRIEFHFGRVDRQGLVRSAERLTSLCSDPRSDVGELRKEARKLYKALLAPVEQNLSSKAVIVEPDEELSAVPFEVLVGNDGRYFIESKSVSYLPGLFFINRLRPVEVSSDKALVVGVSAVPEPYRKLLPPLPDAEEEAREVARELPNARVLTGQTAQPKNVRNEVSEAKIFHFAGHSLYENGRLELLLNASAGEAPLLDLAGLSLKELNGLQLMVLSACSTQGASGESFHQAQNAVRLILQARVPHTIASRWDIDSRTTTEFMKEFYHHFSLQGDTSSTLSQAMNHARQEHAHPYYWAAFSNFGRE